MAKEFYTEGTGNQQVLHESPNEKIPVYDSLADAEADIANIGEGEIIATKDEGLEENIVDTVENGNMNAVTSNAVYDYVSAKVDKTVHYQYRATGSGGGSIKFNIDKKDYCQNVILLYAYQGPIIGSVTISIWGSTVYSTTLPTGMTLSFTGSSVAGGELTVTIASNIAFAYISLIG